MNTTELILCGHIIKRTEHARPFWQFFAPKLVTLEVESGEGYRGEYKMLSKQCHGIKEGKFVRITRDTHPKVYTKPESHLWAFSAPAPKPCVIGRGYLLRITRTHARVRLEDESVIEVPSCGVRGPLVEGVAVRLMSHRHGWLDQYRDRYIVADVTPAVFVGEPSFEAA